MINEYYGDDIQEELHHRVFEQYGVDWIKNYRIKGFDEDDTYNIEIICRYFNLNKL